MARGGARPGAGRKPGSITRKTREIAEAALDEGLSPLEFMLNRMRDETAPMADRQDMAKAAAGYIHPKLSSIEATVDADVTWFPSVVEFVSPDASAD
jgi:hypothetical protein